MVRYISVLSEEPRSLNYCHDSGEYYVIAFQIESLKNVTFNVVSFSVVDGSVGEPGETP